MKKVFLLLIISILYTTIIPLFGQKRLLNQKPEQDTPYRYEANYLISVAENKLSFTREIRMLIKVDYSITYINPEHDFYFEIEGIKGFSQSLDIHSPSKKTYFNSYDTNIKNQKQAEFMELFLGKKYRVSAKDGVTVDGEADSIIDELQKKGVLQPLIQAMQNPNLERLGNLKMTKDSSVDILDSVLVRPNKYVKLTNHYKIKEIAGNEVKLTSTGQLDYRGETLTLAQRLDYNKKTGMPKVLNQYLQMGQNMEMFTQIKQRDSNVPSIFEEYNQIQNIRNENIIQNMAGVTKELEFPTLNDSFLEKLTDQKLSQWVEQYSANLLLYKDEGLGFYYPQDSIQDSTDFVIDNNGYVKTSSAKVITKNSDTLLIPPLFGKPSEHYFTPSYLGYYIFDPYQLIPNIQTCTIDFTVFIPTGTEEIVLSRKKANKGNFEVSISDTSMVLTYHQDSLRNYTVFPMQSLKCFNKKGEEVPYKWVQVFKGSLDVNAEPYTAMDLALIYSNLTVGEPYGAIVYVFEAEGVDKVVLRVCANEKEFSRTITKSMENN